MAAKTLTSRRKLLAAVPAAAIAAITARPAFSGMPGKPKPTLSGTSHELQALIEAHRTAYAALVEAMRTSDARSGGSVSADRIEENALLTVCAFPARSEGDRHAKARYLLEIEARGELDLPQHIRALLRATMA